MIGTNRKHPDLNHCRTGTTDGTAKNDAFYESQTRMVPPGTKPIQNDNAKPETLAKTIRRTTSSSTTARTSTATPTKSEPDGGGRRTTPRERTPRLRRRLTKNRSFPSRTSPLSVCERYASDHDESMAESRPHPHLCEWPERLRMETKCGELDPIHSRPFCSKQNGL